MRITGLWFYPVKGCRGVATQELRLAATGAFGDRQFVVVDAKGVFLTQRNAPELARIEVHYRGDQLELSSDGQSPLQVALASDTGEREIQVWSAKSQAVDTGDDAARWVSSVIGQEVRLMRVGSNWQRSFDLDGAPRPLAFVDGYPLLMISEASLGDLNTRLAEPVPMGRFRTNIMVDGVSAYAEDTLDRARVRGIVLRGVKPCMRCTVTTTDQTTGERDKASEPLRTLARYRNDRELRGVKFGMNLAVTDGIGASLHVGDELEATFR